MKRFYLIVLLAFSVIFGFSQSYSPDVQSIINDVNLDSLTYYLRNLSGEDAVVVNGQTTTIEHRVSNWGNDLAAEYIDETMQGFGYETTIQDYSANGKNIYAIKEGTLNPDEYYIICAHYDAVDYYCADDNGSGSSAVLEAARIFKDLEFDYSIIFAFWDEEELGLYGSSFFAGNTNLNILGVINMDMISWDGDDDNEFEIHSRPIANSIELADYIIEVNSLYNIPLNPRLENQGTTASDHASFWDNDFKAVLIIEEYYGNDFNPYYHSELDRISILNIPYFHNMAKLSIGSLASLAVPDEIISVKENLVDSNIEINCFPNPTNGNTTISITLKEQTSLKVQLLNSMGKKVKLISDAFHQQGKNQFEFNSSNLSPGLYLIIANSPKGSTTFKLLVKKQ